MTYRILEYAGISGEKIAIADENKIVADVYYPNAFAHANLFAAAPELLEALEGLIGYAEHRFGDNEYYKNHGCMKDARAAIAKARGE